MLSHRPLKQLIIAVALVLSSCQSQDGTHTVPPNTSIATYAISTQTSTPSSTPTVVPLPTPNPALGPLQIVGQIGGPTQAVAVAGNYAYVGVGSRLAVLDVSIPSSPREVGSSEPFGAAVRDVKVSDNIAYVAAGGAGLYILDISSPAHPTIMGNYKSSGYTEGVTIEGNYAYVADGPSGLRVVDVTNRAHPVEISSVYKLNYAFDVAIDGSYAYIAAAGAGLLVADVSDPVHPKGIISLELPGNAFGITVSGSMVYIADGWEGLQIVNASNPSQPVKIASLATFGWTYDVAVSGKNVYVADSFSDIRVVDVSNPEKPAILGIYDMPGNQVKSLAVSGNIVYVAGGDTGLAILDVSAPIIPVRVGFYNPMGFADAVAVSDQYAYVAAGLYGLRVVDISDPSHPREVGVYDTHQAYATGVVVAGKYAYLINNGNSKESRAGLHIVDISDPARPTRVSFYESQGNPQDIVINDGVVYIANEWGLELVDVSNPASPVRLSAMDFAQGDHAKATRATWGVNVAGQMAYVTHADFGLEVVDVSEPSNPKFAGNFKSPEIRKTGGVTVGGNFAYVTDVPNLRIVDISNPKQPVEAGFYRLPVTAERVAFSNNTLYLADSAAGLLTLNVSDPHHPTLAGWQRMPGYAFGLSVLDNYVYVADGEGGLFIVQDATKSSSALQISSPPFKIIGAQEDIVAPVPSQKTTFLDLGWDPAIPGSIPWEVRQSTSGLELNSFSPTVSRQDETNHAINNLTLTVINIADSGPGTLREAMDIANKSSGGGTIVFDPSIFPPQHPATIFLITSLPALQSGNLTIDASNAGVILDGSRAMPNTSGLDIQSEHNAIKGLQIINFPGYGIGIKAAHNIIGGDKTRGSGPLGEGNLISGNGTGVSILGITAVDNKVIGNYIGTDLTGNHAMGNKISGVFMGDGAAQNTIGGTTEVERNLISGNERSEVGLQTQANQNRVIGNYIGTNAAGRSALGKAVMGVVIEEAAFNNVIQANVIGNNGVSGVMISDLGTWGNSIIGNFIGVDATGSVSLGGRGTGVSVNESFNRVGGTKPDERNIISGNGEWGIKIGWLGTTDIFVIGNYVGTDGTGTKAMGNGNSAGITLWESGTHHIFVGGASEAEGNLISGNNGSGISVQGIGNDFNIIMGNHIGTDATGNRALPNHEAGIEVKGGDYNFIQGNLIAHNKKGGVEIFYGDNNHIHHNSFVNNNGMSRDYGKDNYWDDGSEGNYWSDYEGKDGNGDGIGDTPYKIPANGIDNYSFIEPFPQ